MATNSEAEKPASKRPDVVEVLRCRACAPGYDFELSPGVVVTVICGIPSKSLPYKAVSYLWETTGSVSVSLECRYCSVKKVVPVRDAKKLLKILNFVSGSEASCRLWMDALSIDQDEKEDKLVQLKVMGDIYLHAEIVSVLLPVGDEGAYAKLRRLAVAAQAVVNYERSGNVNQWGLGEDGTAQLADLFNTFEEEVSDWMKNLHRWRYWTRAWTFQEWTRASELEITCEIEAHKEILRDIKNIIVMAATIVGMWKKSQATLLGLSSASMPGIMRAQEETGAFLNEVRLHFPLSDMLIADNELEGDALRAHTFVPSTSAMDSGTYVTLESPRTKPLGIRNLLSLALTAFTMSERTAHHPADVVECWASMCNISYDYVSEDSTSFTLHKVLEALRKDGLRIFNWHVNTTAAVTDLTFMKYAAVMRQSNSETKGFMFGSPAFTGRADTITHLKLCLEQTGERHDFKTNTEVGFREVHDVRINHVLNMQNKIEAVKLFKSIISGTPKKDRLIDVVPLIEQVLDEMDPKKLMEYSLVTVSVGVRDDPTLESFNAWAICRSGADLSKIFVARESLNGTLVLATREAGQSGTIQIVAYLNMTHQRDGTYLIKSDIKVIVDQVFRPPQQPLLDQDWLQEFQAGMGGDVLDLGMANFVDDRMLNAQIGLGKDVLGLEL